MANGRAWTRKEVETAANRSLHGESYEDIARDLGRTKVAVAAAVKAYLIKIGRGRKVDRKYKSGEFATAVARLSRPGVSDSEIAKILDCTVAQVSTARRRIGIMAGAAKRQWTDDETRQAVEWARSGKTNAQIGERLGRTQKAVAFHLKDKLKRGYKRLPPGSWAACDQMHAAGATPQEIAAAIGSSVGGVYRHLRGYKRRKSEKLKPFPAGYVWQMGDMERFCVRLLALKRGMGVDYRETMAYYAIPDAKFGSFRSTYSRLLGGIRDEMPPDARCVPLPKPGARHGYRRVYAKGRKWTGRIVKRPDGCERGRVVKED